MTDFLYLAYPWIKAFPVMAVISWMAGLFYLPRLFVYHAERGQNGTEPAQSFAIMEEKLLRMIMNPAMVVTWLAGLALVLTPGVVVWSDLWPWSKAAGVLAMTWFHMWLARRRKDFALGTNTRTGRTYRMMNEVPTLLMILIVASVIVKF